MRRLASCASAAALILAAGLSGPASAQTAPLLTPPPANYSLDANGVDLTSGQYILSLTPVQIGQPGGAGMAYNRTFIRGYGWRDNVTGTLSSSGSTYYVSIGASTDVFTLSGSTFTPVHNVGQSLTLNGSDYIYTMPDGTVATFSGSLANVILPPPAPGPQMEANRGRMTELRRPNGETLTYWWETAQRELQHEPNWWTIRLDRVISNYGYALDLTYKYEFYPDYDDVEDWRTLETVTAFNLATCTSPSACPGTVWPSATFSGNNITDQSGRTTYYGGIAPSVRAIRLPENPTTPVATITTDTSGRVTAYATGGGTWTYAYSEAGGVRTVTITDPAAGVTVAQTNMGTGLLTSIEDPLDRTTRFQYDPSRRLTKITYPEGNSVNYAYDARGNVVTTTAKPPVGSTEADIVTSASYPASCANPVTCNQPTTITDPRGGVTNYEYDEVHGGVTKMTLPAPTTGTDRPETRIAYDERNAWISNGVGGYEEWPTGVTLPVAVSTCAQGAAPTCIGTDEEIRTTITYGGTGVANNLHPTVISQGAGDGSLTATTTLTWTAKGDVASADGPLAGTDDTTHYRYDDERELVGVIGPDPDGAGPLLRRAQRNTYDDNGAVTLTEQGTVTGLTDPDWAAFNSLQQVATTYDVYGRPVDQRLQSGSTTYGLAQVSYDTSGRTDCLVTRMNPATFSSLPASACALATTGAFGPDRVIKYGYDAAGQLTSTISGYGSGDTITESVTYTGNGQPETLTDGEGNVSTFVYDDFDRLVRLRYPNASGGESSTTDYETYAYDAASNVTEYRTRGGEVFTSTYDAMNRQTAVDSPGTTPDFAYTYDNLGRALTSVSNGQTLTWTWDALGRQVSEQGPLGTVQSQYDLAGRRTRLTWPGSPAFYVQYDYDVYGDLTKVRENGAASGAGVLAAYTYDNLGRGTAVALGNGASSSWGYDSVSRLTSLTHDFAGTVDDVTFGYAYNPAGQITQRTMSNSAYAGTPSAGSTTYQNNGRNQVTSVGGTAVGYDGNQNVSSALGDTYAYDDLNRLVGANPGSAATLAYDPAGRLERTAGATTTRFLYDGVQAIAEYNASGTLLRRHIPGAGLDQTIATLEGSGTTDRRWFAADERGSVMAISGGTAALLTRNRYDEYGVPASTNGGRFQYTGQMWIGEAGVYHYRARAYASQLGRFLQTDPIGYAAGANVYAYVGGDPVNWVDPTGEDRGYILICHTPPRDENGEIVGTIQGMGPQCSRGPYMDPGMFGLGGGLGGRASFGQRSRIGGVGSYFGPTHSRGPVTVTPEYELWKAAADKAAVDNRWMWIPVLAPLAVPLAAESAGAWAVNSGARGAASVLSRACNCFVEGTEVLTANGPAAIETVEVGDLVFSHDPRSGVSDYRPVVSLIPGLQRAIWEVSIETIDPSGQRREELIGATEEHPWRTSDGLWIETYDLSVGTKLFSADGDLAVVTSVVRTGRIERTYNFEVEGFHTYFVGESGVLVHNACRPPLPPRFNPWTQTRTGRHVPNPIPGPQAPRPGGSPSVHPRNPVQTAIDIVRIVSRILNPID